MSHFLKIRILNRLPFLYLNGCFFFNNSEMISLFFLFINYLKILSKFVVEINVFGLKIVRLEL